ncbi:MAG TPA: TlpA disulfide reductase family protein [Candidatus Sulfotelmatobacter sp.]|nr:TlpA disulfide reductase family protein [Candidatus Sulfotelmatobacter sp.]
MFSRILAVALVAMSSLLAPQTAPQPGPTTPRLGQPAPDFTLPDSTGSPIKLSAFKGKVVLLDFWATWCTGCKVEIPWYVEFENKYGKDGLTAIGVSMDEDGWKSVKPFLEEHKLNYPVVIANQDLANQYGGLPSLPVTLLIDRNGKIAESHAGMVDKIAFENKIKALLHEKPAM